MSNCVRGGVQQLGQPNINIKRLLGFFILVWRHLTGEVGKIGQHGVQPSHFWYSAALTEQSNTCQKLQAGHDRMDCLLF